MKIKKKRKYVLHNRQNFIFFTKIVNHLWIILFFPDPFSDWRPSEACPLAWPLPSSVWADYLVRKNVSNLRKNNTILTKTYAFSAKFVTFRRKSAYKIKLIKFYFQLIWSPEQFAPPTKSRIAMIAVLFFDKFWNFAIDWWFCYFLSAETAYIFTRCACLS